MAYSVTVVDPRISRITLCEMSVVIDGKVCLLRPTINGVLLVCKFGGFEKLIQDMIKEDFDAIVEAVMVGLNKKEKHRKKIEELVWRNGINIELISELVEFIENLSRGGKPKPDDREIIESFEENSKAFTYQSWTDHLFQTGTGWLGWEPKRVLTTTLSALQLAIEGKVDFVKKTNPFGSGEDDENKITPENLHEQPPNPKLAAQQLSNFFRKKIALQQRNV